MLSLEGVRLLADVNGGKTVRIMHPLLFGVVLLGSRQVTNHRNSRNKHIMETSRSNNDDDNEPPQQAPQSRSSAGVRSSPSPDATQAAASEYSSDVVAASTAPQTLELPSGSDDAPLTPHQIAARYERQGSKNEAEEKAEEAGDDEAPLPPAQIDANAKGDEDAVDDSGGGAREGSPSNFPDLAAVNELNPPIPFNPAAVVGDDEIKAADAPPATTQQTEPPICQVVAPPFTDDGKESIAMPAKCMVRHPRYRAKIRSQLVAVVQSR